MDATKAGFVVPTTIPGTQKLGEERSQALQDIAAAERDYEQAKFRGFTEDEIRQYTALERRVQENEKQVLQK